MIYALDFEVFQSGDWCICVYDLLQDKWIVIKNNREALQDFYNKTHNFLYFGFNSVSYDMWIMRAILGGYNPKEMNNWIIKQDRKGWEFDKELGRNYPMNMYDVYIENGGSLKRLEAYMGHSIQESRVDFNKTEPLTEEEWEETIKYCKHDVLETVEVMCRRKNEFDAKWGLIKEFKLPIRDISRTKAQLSAAILGAEKGDFGNEWDLQLPDCIQLKKYHYIYDWFMNPDNHNQNAELQTEIAGVPGVIAWGGAHFNLDGFNGTGRFLMSDVESLYPSVMIQHNLLSRAVRNPERFKEIYEKRLELKHKGKKLEQAPFKIILNASFGVSNFKYSPMYDPAMAHSVCATGQLALVDLVEHVEDVVRLLSANTDSVYIEIPSDNAYEEYTKRLVEWEHRYRFKMENDSFHRFVSENINNYYAEMDAKDKNGNYKIKTKGAIVKHLSPLDYDLAILNFAVNAYIKDGVPPEKTIQDNDNLLDFQKVFHVSSNYTRALKHCTFSKQKVLNPKTGRYVSKEMWNGDGETFYEKTFRVFASTNPNEGSLYKQKGYTDNPQKFANCPANIFIENGNIVGKKCSEYPQLDKMWYINEAWRRINQFYGKK